ncbi:MAG: hypothetical protein HY784_11470 [Chloroflexi bacterium]|nr:hypothetical protein [Chloroflexota bacterium]
MIRSWLRRAAWRLQGKHYRSAAGGEWERVGQLQYDFLVGRGLKPEHYLLDVACGSFRAGRFLIKYLKPGHYFGFDGDPELLREGQEKALGPAGLLEKKPQIQALLLGPQPLDLRARLAPRRPST